MIYLDSCAFLKLLRPEAETGALLTWLTANDGKARVSSTLLETESARALIRSGPPTALLALAPSLAKVHRVEITQEVRTRAAAYSDPNLRSLDAVHLATADLLRSELTHFITYDKRLIAAATAIGLPVASPS